MRTRSGLIFDSTRSPSASQIRRLRRELIKLSRTTVPQQIWPEDIGRILDIIIHEDTVTSKQRGSLRRAMLTKIQQQKIRHIREEIGLVEPENESAREGTSSSQTTFIVPGSSSTASAELCTDCLDDLLAGEGEDYLGEDEVSPSSDEAAVSSQIYAEMAAAAARAADEAAAQGKSTGMLTGVFNTVWQTLGFGKQH